MSTQDIKQFLFEKTGVVASNWKRISKSKNSNGDSVRIFEDKSNGNQVATIETQDGSISMSDSLLPNLASQRTSKVIGYYQFDDEDYQVVLVTKEFWDKHHHLDDSGSEERYVPNGFYQIAEGCYEHDFSTHEEACSALKKSGWVAKIIYGV